MASISKYMTQNAEDDLDTEFDDKQEAIAYAKAHGLKVHEEVYELTESIPVEGADFTHPGCEYTVVLKRTTVEEKHVRVKTFDTGSDFIMAAHKALQGEWLEIVQDWHYVEGPTVDFRRIEE